jgi:hypothetical protein
VSGRGQEEAERRFFEAWLPSVEERSPASGPGNFTSSLHPSEGDTVSRVETGLRRFSQSLRTKFVPRP